MQVFLNDFNCHYAIDGSPAAPVVMFVHALGLDLSMWDAQARALASRARVLRYDLRGHGRSDVTPGAYAIEQLGADALALADALGIDRFAVCGQSLGGMVALWLAAQAPARVTHAVLANTSAKADAAAMESRRQAVLAGGIEPIVEAAIARFFSPAFLAHGSPVVDATRQTLLATDPVGYAGGCAAVRDMDQTASLPGIVVPSLVIGGDFDVSMPWAQHGAVLASSIPDARAVHLPGAHLSCLELPDAYTAALAAFVLE
jgi:3-oxoadipate enol-lactonase